MSTCSAGLLSQLPGRQAEREYAARTYARALPMAPVRAEGARVTGAEKPGELLRRGLGPVGQIPPCSRTALRRTALCAGQAQAELAEEHPQSGEVQGRIALALRSASVRTGERAA